MKNLFAICFLIGVTGCASSFKHRLDFNPGEPIRVMVLPFVQVDDKGAIIESDANLLVDDVPILSSKVEETPPQIVRKLVQNELTRSSLDILSPVLVDVELPHHGFGTAQGKFDLKKIYAANPQELCGEFLDCDAVLYGRVTDWDRSYYGIQSVNSVGIELKLISARDGRVLFSSTAEDSESRGISKGPTGYSSLVIEPIAGLDSEIILDLARRTVKKMVTPLSNAGRPQFLESSPPAIYASSHDGSVTRTDPLIVVLFGTSKQQATFSLGEKITGIPMFERADGHYYGEYHPLSTDVFTSQMVRVSLTDKFGRVTTQDVPKGAVSLAAGS